MIRQIFLEIGSKNKNVGKKWLCCHPDLGSVWIWTAYKELRWKVVGNVVKFPFLDVAFKKWICTSFREISAAISSTICFTYINTFYIWLNLVKTLQSFTNFLFLQDYYIYIHTHDMFWTAGGLFFIFLYLIFLNNRIFHLSYRMIFT